jgi:hypothetical protein
MLSNRESARRSRKRKQEHMMTLEQQIEELNVSSVMITHSPAVLCAECAALLIRHGTPPLLLKCAAPA